MVFGYDMAASRNWGVLLVDVLAIRALLLLVHIRDSDFRNSHVRIVRIVGLMPPLGAALGWTGGRATIPASPLMCAFVRTSPFQPASLHVKGGLRKNLKPV